MIFAVGGIGQTADVADSETLGSWVTELGVYSALPVNPRYDRYSKADIEAFKNKLTVIGLQNRSSEWEGTYVSDLPEIGITQFRLNFNAGFAQYYVYSCLPELRWLNYGRAEDHGDFVQLTPEIAIGSPRKDRPETLVKVVWGKRRYLVEEASLVAFAEKAAGIWVEPSDYKDATYQSWSNYWVDGDYEGDLIGLPTFPSRFSRLERKPISAKIVKVGVRSIQTDFEQGNRSYPKAAVYPLTLNVGYANGAKVGMIFEIQETRDEIVITKVSTSQSTGLLVRTPNAAGLYECYEYEVGSIPCKKLRTGLSARTQIGRFQF